MPSASQETIDQLYEFVKEDAKDHEYLLSLAQDVLHENFHLDGGVYAKKNPAYVLTEKDKAAIQYLIEEWDYGYDPATSNG